MLLLTIILLYCLILLDHSLIERRCVIDIKIGSEVEDRHGKILGTVTNVMRDSWTGEIRKFSVSAEPVDTTLFYSPDDVAEATENRVKLKIALSETDTSVEYGAKVVDQEGKLLGSVNYLVNDSLTGEVKNFKIETETDEQGLIFSMEDVEKITPGEIRLKITANKPD